MSTDKRALFKQKLESGEIRLQPLTFPQRELWEASPVPVADRANHICCLIDVRGKIIVEHVIAALRLVVQRQEALRVSFLPGREQAVQMIRADSPVNFRARELSASQSIDEIAHETFSEPFDLLQGPLYRVELVSRAADDHVLVFAIHHAIADGWTLGVFVQELCVAYIQSLRGISDALPAITLSYTAWGAAERAYWQPSELAARAEFWRKQLAGYSRLWSKSEGAHLRIVTRLPATLANTARDLARQHGATLFSTLLTAFQLAFSEWSGERDILVGTPVANRTKQAINETMGYFAGIVPLRSHVEAGLTFAESLRAVHRTTLDCFANAMPFAELARALGDAGAPGHTPIFEIRFALQNHPIPEIALPGLSARLRMASTGTARFHLGCEITEEGDALEVVWLFQPKLFSQLEVENLGSLFESVLTHANRPAELIAHY